MQIYDTFADAFDHIDDDSPANTTKKPSADTTGKSSTDTKTSAAEPETITGKNVQATDKGSYTAENKT